MCNGVFDVGLISAVTRGQEFLRQAERSVGKLEQLFHLNGLVSSSQTVDGGPTEAVWRSRTRSLTSPSRSEMCLPSCMGDTLPLAPFWTTGDCNTTGGSTSG